MADKTTTLKTKTNDNVYPNVIGDNRDNAIIDSAHINHTLTADHKINFRLDTNVSGLIFNSLQKPAGLTKTELVGVGANGQENIEIGDNLTLANGKLSATGGGSGGYNTLTYTGEHFKGNIEINTINVLNREGRLIIENTKLPRLGQVETDFITLQRDYSKDGVPTGNLLHYTAIKYTNGETKFLQEVIKLRLYSHFITLYSSSLGSINFNYLNTSSDKLTIDTLKTSLAGKFNTCSGYIDDSGTKEIAQYISGEAGGLSIGWFDPSDGSTGGTPIDNTFSISDVVSPVE